MYSNTFSIHFIAFPVFLMLEFTFLDRRKKGEVINVSKNFGSYLHKESR